MDSRFVYICPYTTRELRYGETDKIHMPLETILQLAQEGKLLTINQIYGNYYATPKDAIDRALDSDLFPVLDWPVEKMDIMLQSYEKKLFRVYLEPDNLEELQRRLDKDGRDKDGKRFLAGKTELEKYHSGVYDNCIDFKVVNLAGEEKSLASTIYEQLLQMTYSPK